MCGCVVDLTCFSFQLTFRTLVDIQPITKQWIKVGNEIQQKQTESAIQNKETKRKKEKYTRAFYENPPPDIHTR